MYRYLFRFHILKELWKTVARFECPTINRETKYSSFLPILNFWVSSTAHDLIPRGIVIGS